jgi:hypothetical protein
MKPAPSILSATWDLVPGINCPPGIWNATAAQWQQIVTFAYQKCGASFPPPTPPTPPLWNIYYYCNPCTDSSSPHPWIAGVFSANPGGKYLLYTGARQCGRWSGCGLFPESGRGTGGLWRRSNAAVGATAATAAGRSVSGDSRNLRVNDSEYRPALCRHQAARYP